MNFRYNNNPANLNKRVIFLKPPGEIGEDGWPSSEWTPYKQVWAEVQTQKGYRMFNSDATQWQSKVIIGIRYREDITEEMRVNIGGKIDNGEVIGGQTYEIESLTNEDLHNQWLSIVAKEVL